MHFRINSVVPENQGMQKHLSSLSLQHTAQPPNASVLGRAMRSMNATTSSPLPVRSLGCATFSSSSSVRSVRCYAALPEYVQTRKVKHVCDNKRANFEFELLDRLECGVELKGSEVKSVVQGKISLLESFCRVQNGELFLLNANIAKFEQASDYDQHQEKRKRKLLVSKKELLKLKSRQNEGGLTIVPTKMYFRGPYLKLEVAVARGKKLFDKREDIKRKEGERDIQRVLKNF